MKGKKKMRAKNSKKVGGGRKRKPLSARQQEFLFKQWDKNPDGMTFREYVDNFR
jgi:hypothetical protein